MPRLRTLLATGIALALALTLGVGTASADIFNLDFDHATGEVGHVNPPFGTVTVTSPNSGEVDIVYQANTSQIIGFHEIGFNYLASGGSTISNISLTENAPSNSFPFEGNNVQLDGMGSYTYVYGENAGGGSVGNQATTITVKILGSNLSVTNFEQLSTIPPGDTQGYFAASFARNTTNGVVTGVVGAPNPPTPGAVPEPSTVVIAALGMIGFVGYGLRRRKMS
jgi:hypothetical protein